MTLGGCTLTGAAQVSDRSFVAGNNRASGHCDYQSGPIAQTAALGIQLALVLSWF